MAASDHIVQAADCLEPITLEEMDSIRLMNRVDTKYVTTAGRLPGILSSAEADYRILSVGGHRICGYETLYYDTEGKAMYLEHHNGHLARQKVRVRTYLASDATFLEVKRKNNHGRTKKKRMEIPRGCFEAFSEAEGTEAFVAAKSRYTADELSPALCTSFDRITLASKDLSERLTIDFNLKFDNRRNGACRDLGPAVIIEIKQDGLKPSPLRRTLDGMRIKPLRVSKYCIGSALTDPALKQNRFKQKIRSIEKITKQA